MNKENKEQIELFELLIEECAEVIQSISKAKRFGLNDIHNGKSNLQNFQQEIGDILVLIIIISNNYPEILNEQVLEKLMKVKFTRLNKYIPHILKQINLKEILK